MSEQAAVARRRSWRAPLSGRVARLLVILSSVTLFAVEVPLAVEVHGISLGAALVLSLAHTATAPLALWLARQAAVLSVAASALMMLTVVGSDSGVWPWGVVPLLTQVLVLGVLGFVATGPVAAASLVASPHVGGDLGRCGGRETDRCVLGQRDALRRDRHDAAAFGAVLRQATRIGVDLRRQREISAEEYARRLVVEEKSRVARELHDVIAHDMSLIAVQARSAPHRLPGLAEEVSEEFAQIAARAVDALSQMRGVLTVLRTEEGQSGLRPAPSVRQVPDLVTSVRDAGQEVELAWRLPVTTVVGDDVGASAYRIIQEALSNVRRHAPGATATSRSVWTTTSWSLAWPTTCPCQARPRLPLQATVWLACGSA